MELREWLAEGTPDTDNATRIVRLLSERGQLSSAEIGRYLGMPKSTVSVAVSELRQSGIVVDATGARPSATRAGRRGNALSLNAELGTCVGMQLGPNHLHFIVADVSHAVIEEHTAPFPFEHSPEDAAKFFRREIEAIYARHRLSLDTLLGVGLALPGPVLPHSRTMPHSSLLPRWAGADLREIFGAEFGCPIHADNESNCSAIAEMMWGAAMDAHDFVFLKVDLGIGGAIVVNRRLLTGVSGGAGEFGHISIDPRGDLCACGNRGCVELRGGFRFVLKHAAPLLGEDVTIERIVELARNGDAGCRRLIADAAEAAGQGLAVVGSILNPGLIVIGGRVAAAREILLDPLTSSFERYSQFAPARQQTKIVSGAFPDNDACLGAVGLVLIGHGKLYPN